MNAQAFADLLRDPELTVSEAAALWMMRETEGPLGPEERQLFDQWLAGDPARGQALDSVRATWDETIDAASEPGVARRLAAARERTHAGSRPRRRLAPIAAAAALLLTAAGGFATWLILESPGPHGGPVLASSGTFETQVGERSVVPLEDGSIVTLNTASRVVVDLSGATRAITLERGQALFEVAKDPTRPFVVTAGARTITALGTAFDVRLDADRLAVTLIEGSVSVDERKAPSAMSAEASAEAEAPATDEPRPTVLAPGEQLVVATRKSDAPAAAADAAPAPETPVVHDADIERVTSWREGRLLFDGETLADAVAEVNRYARTKIVLGDADLGDYRVSGVFTAGETASFVDALTVTFPIEISEANRQYVRLTAKGS